MGTSVSPCSKAGGGGGGGGGGAGGGGGGGAVGEEGVYVADPAPDADGNTTMRAWVDAQRAADARNLRNGGTTLEHKSNEVRRCRLTLSNPR